MAPRAQLVWSEFCFSLSVVLPLGLAFRQALSMAPYNIRPNLPINLNFIFPEERWAHRHGDLSPVSAKCCDYSIYYGRMKLWLANLDHGPDSAVPAVKAGGVMTLEKGRDIGYTHHTHKHTTKHIIVIYYYHYYSLKLTHLHFYKEITLAVKFFSRLGESSHRHSLLNSYSCMEETHDYFSFHRKILV